MTKIKNLREGLGLPEVDKSKLPIAVTVDETALAKQQLAESVNSTKFFTSLTNAMQEEWVAPVIYDNFERMTAPAEKPVDLFTNEMVDDLVGGLRDRRAVREVLEEAQTTGINNAMLMRDSYLASQERLEQIAADGWSGVTATALAAMFDPVEWGAILGTTALATGTTSPLGGAAAFAVGAGKQARNAYRTAKVAAIGGAEVAAFEAVRAKFRYDVDGNDVLLAAGLGAGITGGLDAATNAFVKAGERARIAGKVSRGEELTTVERNFFDEYNGEALALKLINKELSGEKFLNSVDGLPTAKGIADLKDTDVQAIPEIAGWNMLGLRKLISTGARLGSHPLGWARYTARALGLNSAGYKGGNLETGGSASEIAEMMQAQYRGLVSEVLPNNQLLWKKRTKGNIADFNRQISRYIRGIDKNPDPEVKEVADIMSKAMNDMAEEAINRNVAGFDVDTLGRHPHYMTRIFNDEKIRLLRQRLGDDADDKIADLVEASMRKGQPDIEKDVRALLKERNALLKEKGKDVKRITKKAISNYVRKIAVAYTKSITDPKLGRTGHAGANEMNLEDLEAILKAGGIEDVEVDGVINLLTRSKTPKAHKRARERLLLDEGTVVRLQNADGSVEDYMFADLLEEDAEQLFNSYVFQMSGAIGLARNGINTNEASSSFEALMGRIKSEGKEQNLSQDEIQEAIDAAQFIYDGITGRLAQRQEVKNSTRDLNIAFRAYSFAVNMGMSGMSALMEISNAMFEYSFKTILKTAPAYATFMRKLSQGKADDETMLELVNAFGIGQEVSLGKWNNVTRFDTEDVGSVLSPERAWADKKGWSVEALKRGENFAQTAQKGVAYWSGLTGVTQFLRRMAATHYVNEWALQSAKGKLPFSRTKLQQLGISDDMAVRIQNIMKSNLVQKNPNGTIKKLNIDQWPSDVRDVFQLSGFKEARQSVQETNIASTNRFMRTELGKTMFQFLNFTMGSMEQQTQRLGVRARRGDVAVGKVLLSAAAMGGLMYATRVQINAAGRSDADEYVQRMMTPEKWAAGAMSQIGAASLFTYILQITNGSMNGNTYAMTPPVVSVAQSMIQSGSNVFDATFTDEEMTETEWRNVLRLAPAQSLYGVRQILNAMASELAN